MDKEPNSPHDHPFNLSEIPETFNESIQGVKRFKEDNEEIPFISSLGMDLSEYKSNESENIHRFKSAVASAFKTLSMYGVSHKEAIASIFKTLAPRLSYIPEGDEAKYIELMEKEIKQLKRKGIKDDEEIIKIFIGRLESSIKVKNEIGSPTSKRRKQWKEDKEIISKKPK